MITQHLYRYSLNYLRHFLEVLPENNLSAQLESLDTLIFKGK